MMERDRKREGLRVCRAAWLLGVTVREFRELEAGDGEPDLSVGPNLRRRVKQGTDKPRIRLREAVLFGPVVPTKPCGFQPPIE